MFKSKFKNNLIIIFSVLLIFSIFIGFNRYYSIASSSPLVSFSADVSFNLTSLSNNLYVLSGSTCDSIDYNSDYSQTVITIPAESTFKIGISSSNYLSITPSGGPIYFTFNNTDLGSAGYISSWSITNNGASSISYSVTVSESQKDYLVQLSGTDVGYYQSGTNSRIEFANTNSGSFSIVRQTRPSGTPIWLLNQINQTNQIILEEPAVENSEEPSNPEENSEADNSSAENKNQEEKDYEKDRKIIDQICQAEANQLLEEEKIENSNKPLLVKLYSLIAKAISGTKKGNENIIKSFIANGTNSTQKLGEGERAGVIDTYYSVYGKAPETQTEWEDCLKIANGRWPKKRNLKMEETQIAEFRKIYLRLPDFKNIHDEAAIMIMAYGIRPLDRGLDKEENALRIFNDIYNRTPESVFDWNILRAIAYSGAKR